MTRIVADITMSLDGYVTAPGADQAHGLGVDGEALHAWVLESQDPVDREVLATGTARTGAVVMGRRLFDTIDGPDGWNEEMGYGAQHVGTPPFFVVTHRPPASVRLDHRFEFVTDGLAAAVQRARTAAHDGGKDVVIMGGGDVIGQSIAEDLVDELVLHLSPLVLGGGTPLFRPDVRRPFRPVEVKVSAYATHLRYARVR